MRDQELRKELDDLMNRIQKSKEHWRFNFSVGTKDGSCYGSSFEDEIKLNKEVKNG